MSRRGRAIGSVRVKSEDRMPSMRDRILEESAARDEETSEQVPTEEGPALDLSFEEEPVPSKSKKKKRNNRIPIDYFSAMDDILADSYTKQEAAFNILEAFTRLMEARGISGPSESDRFENAPGKLAYVSLISEME